MKKIMNFVNVLMISLLLCGCTSVYRSPDLPAGGDAKIAIVEPKDYTPGKVFMIKMIDGKPPGFGLFRRYELTPGRHSITACTNPLRAFSEDITQYFTARAGVRYEIIYKVHEFNNNEMLWNFSIMDMETKQNVGSDKE